MITLSVCGRAACGHDVASMKSMKVHHIRLPRSGSAVAVGNPPQVGDVGPASRVAPDRLGR